MDARANRLRDYLAEGARLPFVWGVRDCVPWACGWVAQERGFDPLAAIRGAYDSRLSCARFLRRQGGLLALARREMDAAGLGETQAPRAGDVGIIETAIGPMGAIRAGSVWAVKTLDGVAFLETPHLAAWEI